MPSIHTKKLYNCILVFNDMPNKVDFQLIIYSYAQLLKQLGASDLTAVNKTNYELTYPIQKTTDVKFVQFSFSVSPQALTTLQRRISIDESILRSFLTLAE
jgi:ribosomal protein S6